MSTDFFFKSMNDIIETESRWRVAGLAGAGVSVCWGHSFSLQDEKRSVDGQG